MERFNVTKCIVRFFTACRYLDRAFAAGLQPIYDAECRAAVNLDLYCVSSIHVSPEHDKRILYCAGSEIQKKANGRKISATLYSM